MSTRSPNTSQLPPVYAERIHQGFMDPVAAREPQMHSKCAVSPSVTSALGAVGGEGLPLRMQQELRAFLSPVTSPLTE